MSRITVVGAGYVGLTTAACLADLGNEVTALDIDEHKIRTLRRHRVPFYEPGLQEVVERNARAGRLCFSASYLDAIPGAEYVFIAVSTPPGERGEADLTAIEAAATAVAECMSGPLIVVNKSTVPIGTADLVSQTVHGHNGRHPVDVVSNPEFLREGSALADFMQPDRIVIGAHDRGPAEQVARLYQPLGAPILMTDVYTAEMIKYASNAYLAARISFINEVARICERVDADVKVVAEGMGLDRRIGPYFLEAGLGFGGSCFPKDVQALAAIATRLDYHPELLHAVMGINRDQRGIAIQKLAECLGSLENRVIGLLGLSFKPNTDDLRDAPSLEIAAGLLSLGARVRAYDPAAQTRAKQLMPEIEYMPNAYAVARDADALLVVTEWNEFRQLDLGKIKRVMRQPVIVDGRNIYEPDQMRALGFTYRGIGRN